MGQQMINGSFLCFERASRTKHVGLLRGVIIIILHDPNQQNRKAPHDIEFDIDVHVSI